MDSLLKLERHRGHFFNWYDTQTLSPLEPRYVSTVDSGNLAGHLIALKQACTSLALQPIHSSTSFFGMMDTLRLFQDVLSKTQDDGRTLSVTIAELQGHATRLGEFLQAPVEVGHEIFLKWETLRGYVADLRDLTLAFTQERGEVASELMIWAGAMDRDVRSHLRDVNTLQPWLRLRLPTFADASGEQHELVKLLSGQGSLADISRGEHALTELNALKTGSDGARNSFDRELPGDFKATLTNALESNAVLCKRLDRLINIAQDLFWQMEFGFLFDVDNRLFSIGYRVGDAALDPSFYDLLASEARFTSLIAIAKRDVPARHWFRLGRRLTFFAHGPTLMSWSGSMFEYLMPSLVLYTPAGSLLDVTCRRVIERQIEYAQALGMPWGVSESAFYVRDRALTYQYADFGVPGLGLKRGLEQDRVIAPYATALAAMYDAQSALTNFGELEAIGGRGVFGFYEAIDFTRERLPEGRNHAVVQTYMAHHQGMSLIAIANVIYYGIMRHRFHSEPIVRAIELLLQERAPDTAPKFVPIIASERRTPFAHVGPPNARYFTSPHTATPATHLLSNGRYAVMLTAAGSGYSVCGKLAVTRWREDVTRDCWGSYIFIRNTGTGTTWSTGFQPTAQQPDDYAVAFFEERARIIRNDGDITTALEVVVSPEDNAEVRQLRVTNTGARACELELTSYAEIVLAPLAADIAHPAFSNLFIQTEYLTETRALLAMRRRRAENEPQVWAAHVIACALAHSIEYETDRARFIGRGGDVRAPLAVIDGRPLSNTVGAVLDPIFSLRTRVRVEPGATVAITYSTIVSESRDAIVTLADKYSDPTIFERISALAWTFAQIQLHYLKIEPEEAQSLQILANRILFLDPSLRPSPEFLRLNRLGARSLWRLGISGDQPIVLLRISTTEDQDIVWQLLRAHGYWRMKCLAVDLVILNEHSVSYAYDLQRLIETIVGRSQALASHTTRDIAGGIFVVRGDALSGEEQALLLTAARAVVVAGQGSLVEQLSKTWKQAPAATTLPPRMRRSTYEPIKLQTPALRYFNGLGGFSADGGEYITLLNKDQNTPAPWINVIANPNFGFMVSESGGSCTFSRNSRSNQLTPWSNDAIVDPAGEIFYLRDEVDGRVWTPCARPIRDNEASYVTHHGKGYSSFRAGVHGILSELHQWVSWSDPVKISRLRLRNSSKVTRRISVTAYLEWVLGATRGESAQYLITHRDDETGALFARNPWNADYGDHVAFADFAGRQTAWTCDRTEFLGRNGGFQNPAALQSGKKLAARDGAGFDACAALQTTVELRPDQEVELVFFLGQTTDQNSARELIRYLRQTPMSQTLQEVKEGWGELLCKVQVRTPDAAMDILLNGWLLYQTISCRYWARAAFYQAGGAYGFRDQLQDSLAIALVAPQLAREHILRASARQFVEGDVQHWWHPPSGRGVRTRVSDDRLWLPYVVAQYIALTGDVAILDIVVSFLDGPPLLPEQDDAYFEPGHSVEHATLYNHCALALDASLKTGVHGLPLMGGGDWNDGMNRVGHEGHGESVWLGWFLIGTIEKFAPLGVLYNDNSRTKRWRDHAVALKNAIETAGWDGSWYRRAYFDNGTPLGSSANTECRIDSLAQSWSVISGVGDPDRARQAVSAVDDYLVRTGDDLVLLFTPPFERTPFDPGYIKGYLPGVRENGGQYTHAAVWVLIANAMLGAGDRVGELFKMLNPIDRTASRAGVFAYKVEPYVIAADIYTEPPHTRRGGWTWYTGAAGWLYQAGIESILGFQVRAGKLTLKPCIPRAWRNYEITFRHHESTYIITVDNPNAVSVGVVQLELDGAPQSGDTILLNDDGKTHRIRAVIGE
ncbi:MAG: glucoamylase family protein [Burkholderiales bacterium]